MTLLFGTESVALGSAPSRWELTSGAYPSAGAILFQDAELWLRRGEGTRVPHLQRRGGAEIPLTLVSRHALSDERSDRGPPIERYRPIAPLKAGTYVLRLVSPPIQRRVLRPLEITFAVRRGREVKPPALPQLLRSSYHVHDATPALATSMWGSEVEPLGPVRQAQFEVRIGEGMLVADFGRADDDPLDNLLLDPPDPSGVHVFELGSPGYGLSHADRCTRSRVRFGVLSAAGQFSGWTTWQAVRFPPAAAGTCPDAPSAAPVPVAALPAPTLPPDTLSPMQTKEPRRAMSRGALVLLGVALGGVVALLSWHLRSIQR
ncbi:MAG: hypothetical protein ABI895_24335 [Deltaproteobacteria bacterium]